MTTQCQTHLMGLLMCVCEQVSERNPDPRDANVFIILITTTAAKRHRLVPSAASVSRRERAKPFGAEGTYQIKLAAFISAHIHNVYSNLLFAKCNF